jgi:hypothetical protein
MLRSDVWLISSQGFEGRYRLHLKVYESIQWIIPLKMKAVYSFETPGIDYPATRRDKQKTWLLNTKTCLQTTSFRSLSFPVRCAFRVDSAIFRYSVLPRSPLLHRTCEMLMAARFGREGGSLNTLQRNGIPFPPHTWWVPSLDAHRFNFFIIQPQLQDK